MIFVTVETEKGGASNLINSWKYAGVKYKVFKDYLTLYNFLGGRYKCELVVFLRAGESFFLGNADVLERVFRLTDKGAMFAVNSGDLSVFPGMFVGHAGILSDYFYKIRSKCELSHDECVKQNVDLFDDFKISLDSSQSLFKVDIKSASEMDVYGYYFTNGFPRDVVNAVPFVIKSKNRPKIYRDWKSLTVIMILLVMFIFKFFSKRYPAAE